MPSSGSGPSPPKIKRPAEEEKDYMYALRTPFCESANRALRRDDVYISDEALQSMDKEALEDRLTSQDMEEGARVTLWDRWNELRYGLLSGVM